MFKVQGGYVPQKSIFDVSRKKMPVRLVTVKVFNRKIQIAFSMNNFRKKEMKKLERLQQKERNGNQMANDFMGFIYDDELGAEEIQGL